jgi:hypothetical protein
VADGAAAETQVNQLPVRHDAMLAACKLRDRPITWVV